MDRIEVHPMEARGITFRVYVTDIDGRWWATDQAGEEVAGAESRYQLREKLMAATKEAAARINLPIARVTRAATVQEGVATGLHANGNVLTAWGPTGKSEQMRTHETVLCGLDDYEVRELRGLVTQAADAQRALREFTGPRTIGLGKAVKDAIAEREAAPHA